MPLLLALFFCHFLGDFTQLSRPDMLAAKRLGTPIWPIYGHATVHGALVAACLLLFGVPSGAVAVLAWVEVGTHFGIDWLKGRANAWFPALQTPAAPPHWYVFGLDQYAHAVVLIFIWWTTTRLP